MRRILYFVLLLALAACQSNLTRENKRPDLAIERLKAHIGFLASDSLKGRKPGTPEGRIAAEYIRDEIKKDGLQLLGDNGFQYFKVTTAVKAGPDNLLRFGTSEAKIGEHFNTLAFSRDTACSAPLVFAGYGFAIDTDSLKWNDYQNLDARGKLVMVLRGDPDVEKDSSAFIVHSSLRAKLLTAQDQGAAGVLFVSSPKFDKDDELIAITFDEARSASDLQAVHIKRAMADSLLKPSGETIAQIEERLIQTRQPKSFAVNQTVQLTTNIERIEVTTQNVVGVLRGSDLRLKDEYVVIGAHYDHLGFGGPGSGSRKPDTVAIHNGADDNASGVAAIVEIAEQLAAERQKLRRSVLFIAFGAEELGLLGSKYFTNNPLVDLNKLTFMLNLDMVGRMDAATRSLTIGGAGTAVGLDSILAQTARQSGLNASLSSEGYGPSDHASFYMKNIPVAFLFTGVHQDYHMPEDDANLLNYEGEKDIVDYSCNLVRQLTNAETALVYQEAGPKEIVSDRRRYKVTLGIMPDFSGSTQNGLRADAVMKGRPAERAGMLKGDIIVAIEGKPVKNIYDYMGRLNEFKKGQRISLDVLRDGQKIILIVDL
jgi:hypothetical protein